jgi:hypothetical protein
MFDQFEPQERHFRYLMISWTFFSFWAVILQTFFQKKLSAMTSWNYVAGWQREIGLWNIGAVVLLILSLNSSTPIAHVTIPVICTWSLLFGTNHLLAYFKTRAHGHLSASFLNFAAVVWAIIIFIF